MPQDLNPPLERPPLSQDPYKTLLTPFPPTFWETEKKIEVSELWTTRIADGRGIKTIEACDCFAREINCFFGKGTGNIELFIRSTLQNSSN
jgi:hypothetical protein